MPTPFVAPAPPLADMAGYPPPPPAANESGGAFDDPPPDCNCCCCDGRAPCCMNPLLFKLPPLPLPPLGGGIGGGKRLAARWLSQGRIQE
jgi:hypothetical protein